MRVLITGGAGMVGSHSAEYYALKIDDLLCVNSSIADEIKNKLPKSFVQKPAEAAPLQPKQQPAKSAWEPTGKTIVIDAGHGGKDPGAASSRGGNEKGINLEVAQQIAQVLRDKGYRVIMTRNNDEFIELEERAAIANRSHADIFVSIHADSSAKSNTNGFTVYVERSSSRASKDLASAIDDRMAQTGISSNGTKKADYRVLTHTGCPAVLIELGYLSNYWEAKQLKNDDMQKRLATLRKLTRLISHCASNLLSQYFQFQVPIERLIFLANRRLALLLNPIFFNCSTTIKSGFSLTNISFAVSSILCFNALLAI